MNGYSSHSTARLAESVSVGATFMNAVTFMKAVTVHGKGIELRRDS